MGYLSSLLKSYYDGDKSQQQQQDSQSPLLTSSQTQQAQVAVLSSIPAVTPSPSLDTKDLYQNPRARLIKQLSVFVAGATFLTASTLVTRRAVLRKLAVTRPRYYTPSNFRPEANGAVEAAEAFALATVNVGALAIMMTGGAMFALDVVNAEDLREKYKRHMGFQDNWEQTADKEIEEWVQGVLDKKENGDYKGVAEGLTALVGVLAGKEEDKDRLEKMRLEGRDTLEKAEAESESKDREG